MHCCFPIGDISLTEACLSYATSFSKQEDPTAMTRAVHVFSMQADIYWSLTAGISADAEDISQSGGYGRYHFLLLLRAHGGRTRHVRSGWHFDGQESGKLSQMKNYQKYQERLLGRYGRYCMKNANTRTRRVFIIDASLPWLHQHYFHLKQFLRTILHWFITAAIFQNPASS